MRFGCSAEEVCADSEDAGAAAEVKDGFVGDVAVGECGVEEVGGDGCWCEVLFAGGVGVEWCGDVLELYFEGALFHVVFAWWVGPGLVFFKVWLC